MELNSYLNNSYSTQTDMYGFNNGTMQTDFNKKQTDDKPKEIDTSFSKMNPYDNNLISDEVWHKFEVASNEYDYTEKASVQELLFDEKFVNSTTTPLTLLDWSSRADVIKNNIYVPNINTSDDSETQKITIANEIKQAISNQIEILDNFKFLLNNEFKSINLVA